MVVTVAVRVRVVVLRKRIKAVSEKSKKGETERKANRTNSKWRSMPIPTVLDDHS